MDNNRFDYTTVEFDTEPANEGYNNYSNYSSYYTGYNNYGNSGNGPQNGKRKKRGSGLKMKTTAMLLSCVVAGGAAGYGGSVLANNTDGTIINTGNRTTSSVELKTVSTGKEMTAAEVYAANVDATVGINASSTSQNVFGYQTQSAASGSGFVISSDGYIITNYHVIEGANEVTVTTNKNKTYDAEIVGYDEASDVAVLKVNASNLQAVTLGSSSKMNVGDEVITIGNPLGELTFSLTSGAISALDREITMSEGNTRKLIQTDAAINSGNSGGALFNMYGEVIGITNAKYSSSSGEASIDNIGFAIPIDEVEDTIEDIIENGTKNSSSSSSSSQSSQGSQGQSGSQGSSGRSYGNQGGSSDPYSGQQGGMSIFDFF